jgi:hypothetical protein
MNKQKCEEQLEVWAFSHSLRSVCINFHVCIFLQTVVTLEDLWAGICYLKISSSLWPYHPELPNLVWKYLLALKISNTKKGWQIGSSGRVPNVKPQYCPPPKKTKQNQKRKQKNISIKNITINIINITHTLRYSLTIWHMLFLEI